MKKLFLSCLLLVMTLTAVQAQYGVSQTGYEGDYFNLHGALDLFKRSHSLRDFERRLNTEDNWVNNLDLDYDRQIDYIRVEHRRRGNFHVIVMQAILDRNEIQDVAAIEIEIVGPGDAVLQMVGDEYLYGEEVIVEPVEGYSDSRRRRNSDYGDYVNVYYWKPVQYILDRQYRLYASPYRWQYYPTWWSPWRQCTWDVFRPRIVIYFRNYSVVRRHRVVRVHNFYRPYRSYCPAVAQRANRVRIRNGRQPIYRPAAAARPDRRYDDRREGVRPNIVDRSRSPRQSPSVSRKRREGITARESTRRSAPRSTDVYRRSENGRTSTRSTTSVRKPPVRSRKTEPARSQAPQARRTSPGHTTRSRATGSSTPSRTYSRKSNSSVRQPSRSAPTTRSATANRRTMERSSRNSRSSAKPRAPQRTTTKQVEPRKRVSRKN